VPAVLMAAQALSRSAAVTLMALRPYVRGDGSRGRHVVGRLAAMRLGVVAATGLLPLLWMPASLRWGGLFAAGAALLVCAVWFGHRLGGHTGDCFGATQQCAELAVLLAALMSA
jgi:adenosylcobinamide-GDP ribazoletransferase